MKGIKRPYDIVLQAIRQHYTYNADTGILCVDGTPCGYPRGRNGMQVNIYTDDPQYLAVQCAVRVHQVAWYLTYGVWAESIIDHIDGDTTNNRISNLRLATVAQSNYNRGKSGKKKVNYSSQYKGVVWRGERGVWRAIIKKLDKRYYLGSYPTEEEAARAYDTAARQLFGRFARLNFPDVGDQADLALPEENGV